MSEGVPADPDGELYRNLSVTPPLTFKDEVELPPPPPPDVFYSQKGN